MIIGDSETVSSYKNQWDRFFDKFGYRDKITKIRDFYPDQKSLSVPYQEIANFDNDFATSLKENPAICIRAGEDLIRSFLESSKDFESKRINIRITNLPEKDFNVEIRDIRSDKIGKMISVSGIVRKNTEVLPRIQLAVFQCSKCASLTALEQSRGKLEEPSRCESCGEERPKVRFKLMPELCEFVDYQKIELQENPETIEGGAQPQRISAVLEDDITGYIFPGDRITIDGILMSEQKRSGNLLLTEFATHLYALNFSKETKEIETLNITPEEEAQIIELSKADNILDKFTKSIAPSIYGHEDIKRTLALQMFGGIRKIMKDGTKIRGDLHILLVGDPGTAKSQLLRFMADISPRGVLALGKGASAAGLTAAAVRDEFGEGRWTLEAGVLVLANNGLAAIDELDKMDPQDTGAMHEAMEQQSFAYDTRIQLKDGTAIRIGEFVDSMIDNDLPRVEEGKDCQILEVDEKIMVPTSDFEYVGFTTIRQVSRHLAPHEMIRIKVEDGSMVEVTRNHPFWVVKDGSLVLVDADQVTDSDYVISTVSKDPQVERDYLDSMISGTRTRKWFQGLTLKRILQVSTVPYIRKWVYDIAVSDNSTFANDEMVLHNSITISKAGIMATLRSTCSVLAAANPTFGKYNPNLPLSEQTKFPLPLLSRFDVIFKLVDKVSEDLDYRLANHILKTHKVGEIYRGMETNEITDYTISDESDLIPQIEKNLMRKYVSYARSKVFPRLSDQAIDLIRNDYVRTRKRSTPDTTPITPRQLESIIRLAEASAKSRLSPVVGRDDALLAIEIITNYLENVSSVDGVIDTNIIMTGTTSRQRGELEGVFLIIKELLKESNYAEVSDVIAEGKLRGLDENKIRGIISKLKSDGQIYEPFDNKLKVVS
jgi:DNA replicative helicase MCM subunit Mcm2 (Cdc46/Mcm family)